MMRELSIQQEAFSRNLWKAFLLGVCKGVGQGKGTSSHGLVEEGGGGESGASGQVGGMPSAIETLVGLPVPVPSSSSTPQQYRKTEGLTHKKRAAQPISPACPRKQI